MRSAMLKFKTQEKPDIHINIQAGIPLGKGSTFRINCYNIILRGVGGKGIKVEIGKF